MLDQWYGAHEQSLPCSMTINAATWRACCKYVTTQFIKEFSMVLNRGHITKWLMCKKVPYRLSNNPISFDTEINIYQFILFSLVPGIYMLCCCFKISNITMGPL